MNYFDFEKANLRNRAQFIWENGTLVDVKGYLNFKIVLYSLNSQFIEIYLDTYSGEILRISFATDEDIEKYTSSIKLPFSYIL